MFVQPQSCAFGSFASPQNFSQQIPFGINNFGPAPFAGTPFSFGGNPWTNAPYGQFQNPAVWNHTLAAGLPVYHQRPSLFELSPWMNPYQQQGLQSFVPPFIAQQPIAPQFGAPQFGIPSVNPFGFAAAGQFAPQIPFSNVPFGMFPQVPVNSQFNPLPFLSQQPAFVDPRLSQVAPTNAPVGATSAGIH